nr:IS5/IS1182 family transposase [Streptomyces sp. NRRL S-1813]
MASEPWIAPFTGLSPRQFGKLVTAIRSEGTSPVRKGRPWSLTLEDRILLVAVYWRTNLTLRRLAPPFGVSKSAADRIIGRLGPSLALQSRQRFRKDELEILRDCRLKGDGVHTAMLGIAPLRNLALTG